MRHHHQLHVRAYGGATGKKGPTATGYAGFCTTCDWHEFALGADPLGPIALQRDHIAHHGGPA